MKESDVIQALCDTLSELQRFSGREQVEITSATCPIGGLPDFDSLNGVEASVALESKLGVQLDGVNIFVNDSGSRALTISEVAKRICSANRSKSHD